METIYHQILNDPRVRESKEQILAVIREKQKELTGVRPPQSDKKESYEALIAKLSSLRGGKIFYPYIGSGFGKGALVELVDGSVKYDFISGIGVHYWGHSHLGLIEANIDAAITDTVMQGHLQQNWDTIHLLEILTEASGLDHCFLSSSGAMANENALKLLFQKHHPADRLLAFSHCFMGRSIVLANITDKPAYREGLPETVKVDYIPFFDPSDSKSIERSVTALKKHLKRHPNQYAAMCFELVQGEGGFRVGSNEFFTAIMDILKEEGIGIFVDEVQTFGRTPSLFAFQYYGLEKYVDVVTIGKLSQVCATLFKKELIPGPGLISQTFTASTSAIRSAIVIISELINGNFLGPEGKISQIHSHFEKLLINLEKKYPDKIQGPWGIGAMVAFTPFKGEKEKVLKMAHTLFEKGVISFLAGPQTDRIRFLVPAEAVEFEDIDRVVELIEETLEES